MSYTETFTPEPGDIDELAHVNNAVWVRWIQEIAVNHWRAVAAPEHVDAFFWVVVRHEVDYLGNMGPGETAEGRTWVGDAPEGLGSTAWWNSAATDACWFAPGLPGRSSTRRRAGSGGCRRRWRHPS